MKISFITTVLNEEKTIDALLSSLVKQSKLPDEVIIVDAGSRDKTRERIMQYEPRIKNFKLLRKIGNRSVGRNEAIRYATGDIIVATDAGCALDKEWIKNSTKPFTSPRIDVVAGYYRPIAENVFEKCLATYTCVMPDRIDKENFLPSSRSIAFTKKAWERVGKYPENLDTCEDLVFAKKMKQKGLHFYTAMDAIVFWKQRKNLPQAFVQFFNYAKGDGKARYIRKQTPFLFARYIFGTALLVFYFKTQSTQLLFIILFLFLCYFLWSIFKNYRYVKNSQAFFWLPLLQLVSDSAVISGMLAGLLL